VPASGSQAAQQLPSWWFLAPSAFILVIFYLIMWRPQQKEQARHREMVDSLKAGDKVITTGGLYGTVVDVHATTVGLRVAEKVKVEVAKSAVVGLQSGSEQSSS